MIPIWYLVNKGPFFHDCVMSKAGFVVSAMTALVSNAGTKNKRVLLSGIST